MIPPPCTRYSPALFDSTDADDHLHARAVCATCPMVAACLDRALAIATEQSYWRGPDGTWAGLLWRNGLVVDWRTSALVVAA